MTNDKLQEELEQELPRGTRVVIRESPGIVKELHLRAGRVLQVKITDSAGELVKISLDWPIELAISKIRSIWVRKSDLMR